MTKFLSVIFYFVCVFLWDTFQRNHFLVSGTDVNSVRVIKNEPSNLPPVSLKEDTDINTNSYRFLNTHFEEKLYAFQTHKGEDEKITIIVWESSDKGENWKENKKLPCEFSNASCEVMSSMVANNELIVIYGNETEYSIAKYRNTSPESEWEILQGTNEDLTRGEAIYYSGNSFELNIRDESPYILCYNLKVFEDRRNYDDTLSTAVAACSFSYTEGKSWEETYYIYVHKNVDFVKMSHLLYLENYAFSVNVITKSQKSLFVECFFHNGDLECERFPSNSEATNSGSGDGLSFQNLDTFENIYSIFNTTKVFIYKREKAYILTVFFGDQHYSVNDILLLHDISSEDVVFHIILTGESSLSIMYEKNKKMQVIYVDLTKKKAGCELLSDGKKLTDVQPTLGLVHYNKNYSSRFLLNSEGVQECYLSYKDIASYASQKKTNKQTFFKWFSATVPSSVNFENSGECFMYSFFKKDSSASVISRLNPNHYASKVIKIRKITEKQNVNMENKKKYYFYFPANFYSYFSDVDRVSCYSTDKKYVIHYTFENNKHLMIALVKSSNSAIQNSKNFNILNTDDKYWLRYILHKPKISGYVMDTKNYLKNYKDSTAITDTGRQLIDQLVNENMDIKEYSIVTFPLLDDMYTFEGVDLTNTSPYYKTRVENIDQDKEFHINIDIRSSGTTAVGLVCPLNEESSPMLCFDLVYDKNNNVIPLEEVHETIPFFVIPKRQLYEQQQLVESLIEYDNFSYQELVKQNKILSFSCKCTINNHTVTVHYEVKAGALTVPKPFKTETQSEYSEEETPIENSDEKTKKRKPKKKIHKKKSAEETQNQSSAEKKRNQSSAEKTRNQSSADINSNSPLLRISDINNEYIQNNSFGIHHMFCSCISVFFFMFYSVFI